MACWRKTQSQASEADAVLSTFGSNSVVGSSLLKSKRDALVEDLGQNVICSNAPWFSNSISRSTEKAGL